MKELFQRSILCIAVEVYLFLIDIIIHTGVIRKCNLCISQQDSKFKLTSRTLKYMS